LAKSPAERAKVGNGVVVLFLVLLILCDESERHCQRGEQRHRNNPGQHSGFHVLPPWLRVALDCMTDYIQNPIQQNQ
jgi:hypothetical protein